MLYLSVDEPQPNSMQFAILRCETTIKVKMIEVKIIKLIEDSIWLKKRVINPMHEWGVFLDTSLFYDAIYHFRGSE